MIDTHCHLSDPRLLDHLEGVLQRALAAGVRTVISISTGLEDSADTIAIAGRIAAQSSPAHPRVKCVVGVHPNYSSEDELAQIDLLRGLQSSPHVVALGEMGLDYHYTDPPRPLQRALFERQLALAAELCRPVVIHSRESIDDCLAVLADQKDVPAVFHCFTGTRQEALRIIAAGHRIGFTGPVTFKKSDELRAAALAVPIERLLVETDAPYLSPEPVRKEKVCEPAMVMHTAGFIAQLRGMELEEFDSITTQNAIAFFRLD